MMNKKIFRSLLLIVFLVLIATIGLIMGILFRFFERQIQTELKNEADFLARAVEHEGAGYFDDFDSKNNRVTLVAKDGTVLYDNVADASVLDNHGDREEIRGAMDSGKGMSVRYSTTLTEKTVNYAVRLSDGSILRVSTEQYTVVTILMKMLQPVLLIIVGALILALVLSSWVSKSIIEPINRLDLDAPENNDAYEELTPLLRKIADQKQTIEEQLADAHKKQKEFNLITENMSEGFLVIDRDENLLTYNSAALKLLDIDPPEADGRGMAVNVLLLCRAKEFREVISDVMSGSRTENIMVRQERYYSLIANPVFESRKVIGAVIVILDITEGEKRDALRREFTANVSHELKTPLTSISGFAELMKAGDVPEENVIDFSESIYDEAQRLITLVNDIIKLSELDENSISYENERVDLYELSDEVISRLENEAAKKNVALHLIGGSAEVTGVHTILEEMLYNLLDNAIKYNREGGTVDIMLNRTEDGVNVIVRDTGIGIPAAHQDRVFERFYRVDKSHSKRVGGTGLGLAIVKHGAMYHHAKISMESAVDAGTAVTLTFPADI